MPSNPSQDPSLPADKATQWKLILRRYLPPSAVEEVYCYLNTHAVHLHITRERSTKLGDYHRPYSSHNYHAISINGNLNPYMFLMVLLHEMAHLDTFLHFGRSVRPHGHEWQQCFAHLLMLYNKEGNFPENVRTMLLHYTAHIPLSRSWLTRIENELSHYNADYIPEEDLRVRDLTPGSLFYIKTRPELVLRLVSKRRTRYQCTSEKDGTTYSVSGEAQVKLVTTD